MDNALMEQVEFIFAIRLKGFVHPPRPRGAAQPFLNPTPGAPPSLPMTAFSVRNLSIFLLQCGDTSK
jgi:hypothetical protein